MDSGQIQEIFRNCTPGDWALENRYEFDNPHRPPGFLAPERVEYGPNRRLAIIRYSEKESTYKADWLDSFRNTPEAAHVYIRVIYGNVLIEERHGPRVDGRRCLVPFAQRRPEGTYYFSDEDMAFFRLLNGIESCHMSDGSSWSTCLEDAANSSYFLPPDHSSGPWARGDA